MSSFNIKDVFQPKFFQLIKNRSYNKQTFIQDLFGGIIVGIVALPMAIALGITAGVSPEQGLLTSIIAGFLISLLGGCNVQIGGTGGASIIIIAGIIAEFGMTGLMIATIIAGVILILIGILKLGDIFKFMPYPIIIGFSSGSALVILSLQIKDFFGLENITMPSEFIDKWVVLFQNISSVNIWAMLIGILTILISIFWKKINKVIPGSLIALILCTIATIILNNYFNTNIPTIGNKYPELTGGSPMPAPKAPNIDMKSIRLLLSPAFTIAILCAIESLLSAMVADGATGKRHHSNTEFIGQGIANLIVPFFGCIPATGALSRTMACINNGGKTPVAGMIHSLFLLLIYFFLMPLAAYIPFSCLAGLLVIVCYNISEWRNFKSVLKNPRADVIVLIVTFFLTVIFDLIIAIEVGIIFAAVLFIKRVMETSSIKVIENEIAKTENIEDNDIEYEKLSKSIEIYEIDGPFFFGIANTFDDINSGTKKHKPSVRIIRMRKVPFIDSTGIKNLKTLCERSKKEKIQIILSGVTNEVYQTLEKAGFVDYIGKEFIFDHISKALGKAHSLTDEK